MKKSIHRYRILLLLLLLPMSIGVQANNKDYYSEGTAEAIPSAVGKVWVWASADGVSEKDGGWTGQGTAKAYQLTKKYTDNAPTYTYYFRADNNAGNSSDTLVGYTFQGWYSDANHTKRVSPNRSYNKTGVQANETKGATHVKFWAYWTANKYTINFDANGGICDVASSTVTYDDTYGNGTGGWPTPSRSGYEFAGWYTATQNGTKIESATTVKITSAQTLHAQWKIAYYGRAESKAEPTTGGGTYVSCKGNRPKKASDYKAEDYSDKDIKDFSYNNPQCTAYFEASTYTGYTFDGWYTESNKGGTRKTTNLSYEENFNLTSTNSSKPTKIVRYAHWTANQYTITFNKQSGTGGTDNAKVHFDNNDFTVKPVVAPTREGYTFDGYYTATNGGGVQIVNASGVWQSNKTNYLDANGKWIKAENTTVYAKWTANEYTVTYDGNNGTPTATSKTVTFDAKYGTLATATRTGYTFADWWTSTTGGTKVTADTKVTTAENHTIHAHWTANKYTVTFNSHEGSAVADKTVTYDATYGELTTPTRYGYKFDGWFTEETGGTQVLATTIVKITAAQTLHAQWTANNYTITLNNQSATTLGTENISVTFDANTNLTSDIVKPTKTDAYTFEGHGYTFEGYFTAVNGGGVKLIDKEGHIMASAAGGGNTYTDASRNWKYANSIELYAYWKQNQTITWNLVEHEEYETGTLMGATATSNIQGLEVSYSSNRPEWGYIDDDNKLQVVVPNKEITITASQAGNENWNAAEPVSKTFTTCGSKPNNWDVSATSLDYGQSLVESSLSGVVKLNETPIEGTLAWVNPAIVPNAGEHSYAVEFTPDNQTAYSKVTFDVSVTTKRANPVLTWNIGTSLRADSKYSNFVVSTNKENTLTITTSSNLSYADNVLTTGPVAKNTTQSGWIKVSQAATTNYYALLDTTVNVTILPRVDVCLPIITMDESVFNEAKVGTKDNVAWCNTNDQGFHDNYILNIDVYYSQKQGIALGKYTEGLDGMWDAITAWFSDNSYDFQYTNKYVDLSFTGVPDSIYFEASSQQVRSVGWIWWIGCWCNKDLTVDWPATAQKWKLYESPDGSAYTQVGELLEGNSVTFKRALKPNTRYVRIEYNGNFTGFVQNLQISQKKYLRTKNGVSEKTFGTEANPLQEPQTVTIQYSSLGDCENKNTAIYVSTDNNAFYVDETSITDNVGLDQMGEYTIRVRCNDVNKEGKLIFTAFDGTTAEVSLTSTKPSITSAATEIFQTGTEHSPDAGTLYRTLSTHDFSACFNGANPRFDTLYIYGVSASSVSNRQFVSVGGKDYKVPVVTTNNVLTPCFVYRKNGTQYTYVRTFDAATKTLNTYDADKALGFVGYKPANTSSAIPAIQLNSSATLYLGDAEIIAGGAALKVNNTIATIYARGENKLIANNSAASVQLAGNASLTIRDRWIGSESPRLDLIPASEKPSVDLSANSTFIISGSQVELHNAALNISGHNVNMAIANMSGADKTTGSVLISDGTITSDDGVVLGMPLNTIINGGTFNDIENVVTFDRKGRTIRPKNSRNELLALTEKTRGQLPDWYGKTYLIEVAGKVFPMLEDKSICKFMAKTDQYSNHESNWTSVPNNTTDVLITKNMEVKGTLEVKSFTINPDVKVTVKEGATLKVGDYDSFWENTGSLQIAKGGKVELTEGVVSVKDLTIEASLGSTVNNLTTPASSGEVNEENLLDVNGDVYFKLELDPSGRNTYGWYDFVVPFEVDVIGGISIAEAPGARMVFNGNYAIMAFDERRRAETGKGWSKFTGTMVQGQVYTITLDETQPWNTVVFKKKIGASLAGERSITSSYSDDVGEEKDRGWNGYGNATLHHTKLNAPGVSLIQVYDHTNKCYQPREIAAYKIAVGMSFFMQVDDKTVVALDKVQSDAKGGGGYLAPARESKEVETFRLSLTKEGQNYASDLLWVSASEEATGEYVIGHDLAKMGDLTSSKVARMWAKNNNIDLCDIEMPLVYGQASCELNMYVPEQATYALAVEEAPEDADLFLTYNGKVIWNLTSSPAEIVLNSGLKTDFGLILKSHNAPDIAEGVDNIDEDNHSVRKVLIDNTIYVITPDGAMYDVNGKLIR